MSKSNARHLSYVPHPLAFNGHAQTFFYCWIELLQVKLRNALKYERELMTLSDGGTIALDWHMDETGGKPHSLGYQRPILVCFSGLSGGNDNLYLYSMIKQATLAGFKCVVVNFRGSAGIPLTSGKIYWMNLWQDIKEPVDFIHQRYPRSRLYAYSVSLGASMLVNYL